MATKVEVERAKIKQLARMESKLMKIEDKIEILTELLEAFTAPVAEATVNQSAKPKKVKSEK